MVVGLPTRIIPIAEIRANGSCIMRGQFDDLVQPSVPIPIRTSIGQINWSKCLFNHLDISLALPWGTFLA